MKSLRLTILCVSAMIFFVLISCEEVPSSPNNEFSFVMGTNAYTVPNLAMPERGKAFQDNNFTTTIVRVTDKNVDGYSGPGIQNEYSKMDPENCDGTYVILRGNDAALYLYNPATYRMIKPLTSFNSCNQEIEPRWDNVNPKVFYYVCNAEFCSFNVDNETSEPVHDFTKEYPNAAFVRTKVEGDGSLDRRYWAFMVEDVDYNMIALIVYDKSLDSIVGIKNSGFEDAINWVGMSMSGNYCIVGYENLNYLLVCSRDLKECRNFTAGSNAHADLALSADGKDVIVYQNVATDWIAMSDLETGVETNLINIPFNVNPDIGMHFSGNCSKTPGWVLVSTYCSKNPPSGSSHSWMDAQLFMLELKDNPRIWRIADTHAYTSKDFEGEKNYFAECFAAINNSGTRVYFGSNWEKYVQDYSEAYMIMLPANWINNMPK